MKILFIACYSPFINNSASIRTLYYLNNLCNIDDNEVHLLTVDFPKDSIYYDEYILGMLNRKVKVHTISGGKLFNKVMPRKSKNEDLKNDCSNNKKISFLKKVKSVVVSPDMYYNWSFKAAQYGIELMKKEKFNVIFSMHEPPSSHMCAYRIKKEFKDIPWVAYFSDPWIKDPNRSNMPKIRKKFESHLEKKVIKFADKYVFVTERNRQDYIDTYGIEKEKTFIAGRGFDLDKYEEVLNSNPPKYIINGKINMVHTGEIFTKIRDVNPFIKALNKLEKSNKQLYEKLNIMFFGNIDDINIKNKLQELSIIRVENRVPYKEALEYMIHSEVLILFSNKNSNQIPGKIYDYFGTKNSIFVILGDENDPIIPIVENKDKCVVTLNTEDDILENIYGLIESVYKERYKEPIMEYEWSNVVYKLNEILKE